MIDGFDTVLELARAEADQASAAGAAEAAALPRAQALLARLREAGGQRAPLALRLQQVPPAHAGFGTGTQLALALGHAYAQLFGLRWDSPAIARLTGRGLRSGIGVAGFDGGGLLVDAGPGRHGGPAPVLGRVALPAEWCVLLALDARVQGLAGEAERAALATLAPLPQADAAALAHEVLMRVWPAAVEGEFEPFATGISHIQQMLGAHFAPAQQGRAYTSAPVGRLMDWIARRAHAGVGQSSWGPTGFAVLPSLATAQALAAAAQAAGLVEPGMSLHPVRLRAAGASRQWLHGSD